ATMEGEESPPQRKDSDLVQIKLHGKQPPRPHRQGELLRQHGRQPDAGKKEPAAAGPQIFQPGAEVTVTASPWSPWVLNGSLFLRAPFARYRACPPCSSS